MLVNIHLFWITLQQFCPVIKIHDILAGDLKKCFNGYRRCRVDVVDRTLRHDVDGAVNLTLLYELVQLLELIYSAAIILARDLVSQIPQLLICLSLLVGQRRLQAIAETLLHILLEEIILHVLVELEQPLDFIIARGNNIICADLGLGNKRFRGGQAVAVRERFVLDQFLFVALGLRLLFALPLRIHPVEYLQQLPLLFLLLVFCRCFFVLIVLWVAFIVRLHFYLIYQNIPFY